MPRKGLTRRDVLRASFELIDESGFSGFSMNELARRLNIRPASLYNHIENEATLLERIGRTAETRFTEALEESIAGLSGRDALFSLACAWRRFAVKHSGLYAVVMRLPKAQDPWREPAFFVPVEKVVGSTEERDLVLAALHGAASFENGSVFSPESDGEGRFASIVTALANSIYPEPSIKDLKKEEVNP